MRIGINGLLLTGQAGYRQTGVARYIERLVTALPTVMPDAELLVHVGRGVTLPPGVEARRAWVPTERPPARLAWERAALPILARRDRLSLFHGTVNTLPAALPCPAIVTVHDLALLRWPEQVPARRFRYLSRAIPHAVRRAARVLAVSEATKRDLVELLKVPSEKIAVTPLGVDERFHPVSKVELGGFRERHGLTRPFLLTVCTLEPRKNLPRLLEAFALVRDTDRQLVIVGPEGWLTGGLRETLERLDLRNRVRLTGFVPDDELPLWYNAADLFVFPSLYEGFGLPVLEAMACGAPVVTSNISSLPEVAGDAAIYVEPESVESIAKGIEAALGNSETRERMSRIGVRRAREFTWRRTAELTAAAYREVLR